MPEHLERAAKGGAAEQILASEFEAVRRFYALWTAQKQLLVLEATAAPEQGVRPTAPQALFEAGRGNKGDALAAAGEPRERPDQRARSSGRSSPRRRWISPPGSARPRASDLDAVDPALPETPPPAERDARSRGSSSPGTNRPLLVQCGAQVKAAEAYVTAQAAGWAPRLQAPVQYSPRGPPTAYTVYTDFDRYGAVTAASISTGTSSTASRPTRRPSRPGPSSRRPS